MDILLIIIWIVIFIVWYYYQKIKKLYDEFDGLGIPYVGLFEGWKNMFKLITLKEGFIELMDRNYFQFKDQQ